MLLIADSGSTKTSWCLVDRQQQQEHYKTIGYNPHYISSEGISKSIQENLLNMMVAQPNEIKEVHFYGAGCSTPADVEVVNAAMRDCFPHSRIVVEHDLLAAARALCGRNAGIACILGTGSNSCFYDGSEVKDNVDALGFMIGDEGGGANLGKLLIKSFFYRDMPSDLKKAFDERYQLTKAELFDNVYQKPLPNRYMAQYTLFYRDHLNHPFIQGLLQTNFRGFLQKQVSKYEKVTEIPIHFIGSIAYYFKTELNNVMKEMDFELGQVIRNPMEGLINFHTNNKE